MAGTRPRDGHCTLDGWQEIADRSFQPTSVEAVDLDAEGIEEFLVLIPEIASSRVLSSYFPCLKVLAHDCIGLLGIRSSLRLSALRESNVTLCNNVVHSSVMSSADA